MGIALSGKEQIRLLKIDLILLTRKTNNVAVILYLIHVIFKLVRLVCMVNTCAKFQNIGIKVTREKQTCGGSECASGQCKNSKHPH